MGDADMLQSHERRIQRIEDFVTEASLHMGTVSEGLKNVSEQLEGVGRDLKAAIEDFKTSNAEDHETVKSELVEVKKKQTQHSEEIAILLSEREARLERVKTMKKMSIAAVIAGLAAVATKFGEALYQALTGHK